MSEVNQAFLRAYLKNRASQASSPPFASVSLEPPFQNTVANRPAANAPRQPLAPPTQIDPSSPSGKNLRFDPAHSEPQTEPRTEPSRVAVPESFPVRTAPRQGVWSPLGAERGMKAMESSSAPAYVRNGVPAVTSEAAQYRRPTAMPQAQPVQQSQPTALGSAHSPHAARVAYDQVMYVDGLSGHAAAQSSPATMRTERTIAEITEPIAFGTGTSSTVSSNRRVQTAQPVATSPVASQSIPSIGIGRGAPTYAPPKQTDSPQHEDASVTRRIDSSHKRSVVESSSSTQPITLPPTSDKTSQLKNGLPLPVAFNPSWEVDQFFWPEVVKHIESSNAAAFQQISKHLSLANRDGLKVMAVTSGERGVGRSTVAMHMARCAASAGLRVALLDGDTYCPSLIDQLRLDQQQGWQDCLFENVPLYEIAIHSLADNITLFPLTSVISQQQVHANLHRIAKLIRRISNAFDMVFIDANRLNLEQRDMVGVAQEAVVDAAIVVVDTELSIKEKVDSAVSILRGMGVSSVGLVENFQS
jgi:Mrp family chromosome partitioning ATPase